MAGTSLAPAPTKFTGADPAAGQEILVTVPADEIWEVYGIVFTLVTDATVATRTPILIINDGAEEFYRQADGTGITASLTVKEEAARFFGTKPADLATVHFLALPELFLGPGFKIITSTTNIQAGDNYGAPIVIARRYKIEAN